MRVFSSKIIELQRKPFTDSWTSESVSGSWYGCTYDSSYTRGMIVGSSGKIGFCNSNNLSGWTTSVYDSNVDFYDVVNLSDLGYFCAVGTNGSMIYKESYDNTLVKAVVIEQDNIKPSLYGAIYINDSLINKVLACGTYNGYGVICRQNLPLSNTPSVYVTTIPEPLEAIAYSKELKKYIAVGQKRWIVTGTKSNLGDNITWGTPFQVSRPYESNINWTCAVYGNQGFLVGGTYGAITTSKDCTTFTKPKHLITDTSSSLYEASILGATYKDGIYTVVGNGFIAQSYDLISWDVTTQSSKIIQAIANVGSSYADYICTGTSNFVLKGV